MSGAKQLKWIKLLLLCRPHLPLLLTFQMSGWSYKTFFLLRTLFCDRLECLSPQKTLFLSNFCEQGTV
jgi:hypothetical protein